MPPLSVSFGSLPWRAASPRLCGEAVVLPAGSPRGSNGHHLPGKGALKQDPPQRPLSHQQARTADEASPLTLWQSGASPPSAGPSACLPGLGPHPGLLQKWCHACCSPERGAGSPSPRLGAAPGSPPVSWEKGLCAACGKGTLNTLGWCGMLGGHVRASGDFSRT